MTDLTNWKTCWECKEVPVYFFESDKSQEGIVGWCLGHVCQHPRVLKNYNFPLEDDMDFVPSDVITFMKARGRKVDFKVWNQCEKLIQKKAARMSARRRKVKRVRLIETM